MASLEHLQEQQAEKHKSCKMKRENSYRCGGEGGGVGGEGSDEGGGCL